MKSHGFSDLRGGGSYSGRLTAGLVAAGSISRHCIPEEWIIESSVHTIGGLHGSEGEELAKSCQSSGDSIGSQVLLTLQGLPIGLGEPWFDGLEPALAGALMAIPLRGRWNSGME